jgi:spore maturation protein CgeB
MRAVVVHPGPAFSVADVHNGVVAGLKGNGVDTIGLNFDDYLAFFVQASVERNGEWVRALEYEAAVRCAAVACLEAACYEFWPDIVVIISGFFIPPEKYPLMRERGHKVVLWCTESPYEDERQMWMASSADVVVVNDPTNLDEFRKYNKNSHYIPHSYNPAIHQPGPANPDLISDFCFVGTGYPSRIEFLEKVDYSGLDRVLLAGNWGPVTDGSPLVPFLLSEREECIDNADTVDLYRSTNCSANLYRKEAMRDDLVDGWAMGPREVELAACETFYAREPRGESDLLFPMLPTFTTPAELGDIARWAKANPTVARDAARHAHAAIAERTFDNHVAQLLRHTAS